MQTANKYEAARKADQAARAARQGELLRGKDYYKAQAVYEATFNRVYFDLVNG